MALFEFTNPSGSSYFIMETARNTNGVYDNSSLKAASGSLNIVSNIPSTGVVQSDYIWGTVVPPGSSSLAFTASLSIPTGSVYFRGTGEFTVTITTDSTPPTPTVDPDAQLFITNAAITDSTQQTAINTLVTDLKGYGIWSKMKALYPFVGGTAAQHKFNLRNPVDSDAAFRLVFYGGVTHNSNGITGNSTNAYADTLFKDSVSSTPLNKHISMYQRNLPPSNSGSSMGAFYQHRFYLNISGTNYSTFEMPQSGFAVQSPQNGFFAMSKIASVTAKYYQNSLTPLSRTGGADLPSTLNYGLLASFSGVNSAVDYSSANLSFTSIGDGLSDSQYTNLYTAVQTFQTTLNRQVGVPIVADSDAQAFLNAAVITDTTQASAVNTLVTDLKGYGIWTKMKAIYPFVGGTASQHKFNLRNPLDTDAAFRLVFNGGWTHSNTGALPNGTNAWANTWFKSGTNFTSKDNAHYSFYSRTDLSSTSVEIGANADVSQQVLHTRKTDGKAYFIINGGAQPNFSVTNSLGFYQANRNVLNIANGWKNGAKLTEITSTSVVNNLTYFSISAYNNPINSPELYSAKQAAFASFGDGLTDTQAANYYTAVQTFQTTLSRNV